MGLKIIHYFELGIPVLRPEGRVTIGDSSEALRTAVRDCVDKGAKKLIIELGRVYYIDSSGVGEIFSTYTYAHKHGCTVVYAGLAPKVIDLLTITKLLQVLDVYSSVQEAAKAISQVDPAE